MACEAYRHSTVHYDRGILLKLLPGLMGWTAVMTDAEFVPQLPAIWAEIRKEDNPGGVEQYFNKLHHTKKIYNTQTIKGNQTGTFQVLSGSLCYICLISL